MAAIRWRLGLAVVAVLSVAICCGGSQVAEEPAAKKAPSENNSAAKDQPDEDAKAKEDEDRYKLPKGGVKELLTFIRELRAYRPPREKMLEHRQKSMAASKQAAEKIRDLATDDDKALEGYDEAMDSLLLYRAQEAGNKPPRVVKILIDDIKKALESPRKPTPYLVQAARTLAMNAEYSDRGNPERAAEVYREMGDALAKSQYPEIAKQGATLQGAARRVALVGNPLELSGTLMDGSKFDWEKYRGKVVLVDFWATWCGPCIAEIPNVKENYEKYHDRGFEVVGVSLNRDRQALEAFIEKEKNPWLTLHDGDWGDNAVAQYYGIMGIPTVILVDKDGKVVSTRARGPELGKLLAQLLGPAEAEEKKDEAAAEK